MSRKVVVMDNRSSETQGRFSNDDFAIPRSIPIDAVRGDLSLSELVTLCLDSWRLIAGTIAVLFFLGLTYVLTVSPIYNADVLLQIEDKKEGVGAIAELSQLLQKEPPVSAEFEILRSRLVLGAAVDNLKLNIETNPKYFPILGGVIARNNGTERLANPWLGMSSYTWGGERVKVNSFDVPNDYLDKEFTLVIDDSKSYSLFDEEKKLVVKGKVGEATTANLDNGESVKLFVSGLRGNPGARFEIVKKARLSAIADLQENLKIEELGKQSGMLRLTLEGTDRQKVTNILNEIANIYLRQSVERKSAEAEKTLTFLEKQLPKLKAKMENAEAALNNYRLQKGSVDLPMETQATLEKIVSIDSQVTQLQRDREDLIRRFQPQHPRIAALDAQIKNLNYELDKVDSKVKRLPGTQQEILRLTRDADVSRSLYTTLMNSAQELKVVKAGAIGNVRIVDYAIAPLKSIKPKKPLIIALCLLLGLILGVGLALIQRSLNRAVQNPEVIEKKFGLPVYATIPYSPKQRELMKTAKRKSNSPSVLAIEDPEDLAIESLRSLRTSLYFAQLNATNNLISITSPSPGAGKSFICVNLATVLAKAGKRVLLVDADLRKGRIHEYFGVENSNGLSDLIAHVDEAYNHLQQFVHNSSVENLDFVLSGTVPPNPSELLLHEKFLAALGAVSQNYDHVIIDSPPILAATDAAIIGNLADATLLVVKHNRNPLSEIELSVKRLRQAGVNLRGTVYNGIKSAESRYGHTRYYYAYTKNKK